MVRFARQVIRRKLAARGIAVVRTREPFVAFEVFADLAAAYEELLRGRGAPVDPDGDRARLLARGLGTRPPQAYALVGALHQTASVPGAVCEFGVAQGATSALLAHELLRLGEKELHLFDSFRGLPAPTDRDRLKDDIFGLGSMGAYAGTMAYPRSEVLARLAEVGFPPGRTVVHEGFFADTLAGGGHLPESVSFAYVDFDLHQPVAQALDFLHGVTTAGSVVVVDDYDFFSTGAKDAVDEFAAARNSGGAVYDVEVPEQAFGRFAVLTRRR